MRYNSAILGLMATSATMALLAGPATAQTASAPQPAPKAAETTDQTNEEIVVTGIRRGVISAIEAKKKLDVIADVVTAQDIGKFPDTTIAESLQRITGVQITRDSGEGKFVSVRGLPPEFNVVTMNGHYVANGAIDQTTQASDRKFDFSILPPDFIQALEVYKTPRADLDEGGVSSTINIKTLRPLELGKRVLSASAEGQYEGNSKKWSPKVSGVYSDTFLDGRLGIAVSGVYNQRKYTELSTTAGQLDPITFSAAQIQPGVPLTAGKNYLMVDSIGRTRTDSTRTRKTFAATVQFEPVDHLRFTAEGLYADFKGDSHVAGFTSRPIYGVQYSKSPVTQATVDANNVITSLQTTDSAIEVSAFDNRERNTIKSGSADMTFDDGVTFARLKGAYSEATARIDGVGLDYFIWGPISTTTIPGGYVMDPNDPIVKIVIPTGVPTPSQFPLNQAGNNDLNRSDRSFDFQGDFARDLGSGPIKLLA